MSSTPDSVSMSDLMAFSEKAAERAEEESKKLNGPFPGGLTQKDYHEKVVDALQELHNREDMLHPMFAKIVALELLNKLTDWHTQRGEQEIEDGNVQCGVGWLRDAGKLQASMSSIIEVMLPDDYIFDLYHS